MPSADVYLKGLNILLAQIEALPQEIHPDLIVVSDLLAAQLGVKKGLEDANSGIRLAFPNIAKHTNFHSDQHHRNHIHVSFGAKRAGSFEPIAVAPVTKSGVTDPATTTPPVIPAGGLEKFKVSYKTNKDATLSRDEVMQLLVTSGLFGDEIAALFVGISDRESGGWHPGALNGNRGTGDFSFGLFQINFLPKAGGNTAYPLIYPVPAKVLGVKLAYSIDSDTDVTSLGKKVITLASRETTDERMFIPYNQVHILATKAVGLPNYQKAVSKNTKINDYFFNPWGDYKTLTDAPMGSFSGVKYSVVRDVYIKNTANSEAKLKAFIKAKFKNKPAYAKLTEWFSGYYYTMAYKNGNGTYVPSKKLQDPKF